MKKIKRFLRNLLHDMIIIFMPKFMLKNMLSCEQVSYLLANSPKLSKTKNFKLKLHLFVCQCCTDTFEQMNIIKVNSQKLNNAALNQTEAMRAETSKLKVIKSLTKKPE